MFEKISSKRLAGLILAGVITISGATTAFAADQSSVQQAAGRNKPARMDFSKMSAEMKAAIEKLVTAGTITQAQADVVAKVFKPGERKGIADKVRKNPIEELVTAGTITQVQADAVCTAVKSGREAKKSTETVLTELVTAGTITQAQADPIAKVFKPGARKGTLTKERKSPITELVTTGTITQAQADAVNIAIKAAMDSMKEQ